MKYTMVNVETLVGSDNKFNEMDSKELSYMLKRMVGIGKVDFENEVYTVPCNESAEAVIAICEEHGAELFHKKDLTSTSLFGKPKSYVGLAFLNTQLCDIEIQGTLHGCVVYVKETKLKSHLQANTNITAGFGDVVSKVINHKGFLDSDTNLKIILKLLPVVYKYDSVVPIEVAEKVITNVWNTLQGPEQKAIG
jgi:hypothetical protein